MILTHPITLLYPVQGVKVVAEQESTEAEPMIT
jgi:hypothetical protein